VLLAIGLPPGIAHGSLRLSLGRHTTAEDIDFVVDNLVKIIERLRKMSPIDANSPIDDAVYDHKH